MTAAGSLATAANAWRGQTPAVAGALRETDSGIQVAIQKIHEDVDRHEEERDHEHGALHQRVVALQDRGEEHATDTRHGEDLLDHDRAAQQLADLYAQERDDDDEPVPEDVAAQHSARREALRSRGP